MTKEEFFEALEQKVLGAVQRNNPYRPDLTQQELDEIIEDNKLDASEAIAWLFDSGLYMSDEGHNGFFCPTLREKFTPRW
jgi:hypothetical protein